MKLPQLSKSIRDETWTRQKQLVHEWARSHSDVEIISELQDVLTAQDAQGGTLCTIQFGAFISSFVQISRFYVTTV
jgi:hypothetical protein